MIRVIVTAPTGGTIHGPATVSLSPDQHRRRAHVVGPWKDGGLFDLDGGQVLTFKRGEEVGVSAIDKAALSQFAVMAAPKPKGRAKASDAD